MYKVAVIKPGPHKSPYIEYMDNYFEEGQLVCLYEVNDWECVVYEKDTSSLTWTFHRDSLTIIGDL